MPQLSVEYTANLHTPVDAKALVMLNTVLAESGEFSELDIKSRAVKIDTFAVGTADTPRAYISAKLALLSGRSAETKKILAQSLHAALEHWLQPNTTDNIQITVEIIDMDRASYSKSVYGV